MTNRPVSRQAEESCHKLLAKFEPQAWPKTSITKFQIFILTHNLGRGQLNNKRHISIIDYSLVGHRMLYYVPFAVDVHCFAVSINVTVSANVGIFLLTSCTSKSTGPQTSSLRLGWTGKS